MSVSDYGSNGSSDPFRTLVETIDGAISVYASETMDATQDLTGLALWLSKARSVLKKRDKAAADSISETSRQPLTQVREQQNGVVINAQNLDRDNKQDNDANTNSVQSTEFVMEELDNPFSSVFDDDFVDQNGAVDNMDVPSIPAVSQTAYASETEGEDENEEEAVENDEEWDRNRLNLQRALIKKGNIAELEHCVADTHKESAEPPSDEKRRLYDLVQWSKKQRRRKLAGDLDPYQITRLDDLCDKELWSWEEAPSRPREVSRKAIFSDGVGTIGNTLQKTSSNSPVPSRSTLVHSPQLQQAATMKKAAAEAKKASLATKRAAMKAVKEARAQVKMRGSKAVNKEWDKYFSLVKKHMPLNNNGHIWDMPLDYVAVSQGKTIQLGIWLHVQRQELGRYEFESPNWYNKLATLFEQGWSMEPQGDLDVLTSLGSGSGDDEDSIPGPTRNTSPPGLTEEQPSRHSTPVPTSPQAGLKRKAESPLVGRVQKAPRQDSSVPVSPRSIKSEPGITTTASKPQAIDLCESSDMSSVHSSSSSGSSSSSYSSSTSSSVKSADSQESTGANSYSLKDKKLFAKPGSAFTSASHQAAPSSSRTLPGSSTNSKREGIVLPPRVPDLPSSVPRSSSSKPPHSASMPSASTKPARPVSPRVGKAHHQDGERKEPRDPRLKRPDTQNSHTLPVATTFSNSNGGSAQTSRVASPVSRSTTPTLKQKQKKVPTHSLLPLDGSADARAVKASSRSPSLAPIPESVPTKPATPMVSPLVDGKLRAEGNYVAVVYSQSSSLEDARFAIAKQLNDPATGSDEVKVMRLLPENPSDLFYTRYKYTFNPTKVVTTTTNELLLQNLRFLVGMISSYLLCYRSCFQYLYVVCISFLQLSQMYQVESTR